MVVAIVICSILAAASAVAAILSFLGKGPLIATTYFVATPEERQKMKTKAAYRFVGAVFAWIAALLLLTVVAMLKMAMWMFTVVIVMAIALAVFVVYYSIRGETRRR